MYAVTRWTSYLACTVALLGTVTGCRDLDRGEAAGGRDAGQIDAAAAGNPASDAGPSSPGRYPPPRTDLVPAVGRPETLDIATWNIENFPKADTTASLVADLIASLQLDLVALQEIQDEAAFDELVERLPDHEGILSTHAYGDGSYQKLGFLYRRDLITVTGQQLLFTDRSYELPRPPLELRARVGNFDFVAIVIHLKAGRGNEDRERRAAAVMALDGYLQRLVAQVDEDVVLLGDFNEVVTTGEGLRALAPIADARTRYDIETRPLAERGEASFLPSGVVLDHIVTGIGLAPELGAETARIVHLDASFRGYEYAVSDHLPVVISMPLPR